jgi:hypothetical protein
MLYSGFMMQLGMQLVVMKSFSKLMVAVESAKVVKCKAEVMSSRFTG